jgi:hypothetical protein
MSWKLKIDEKTGAPVVTEDGKIVYINPDGDELPLDPPAMYEKISTMGKDNQKDRDKYRELRAKYSAFDNIDDIDAWREEAEKAIATVTNFNDKDYLKAEKVEKIKADMNAAWEEKMKAKDQSIAEKEKAAAEVVSKKDAQIRQLLVSNKFAVSPYFNGSESKTLLPPDLAESYFGKNFKVEESDDGTLSIKAYDVRGELLTSKLNPGEPAEFDEAIGMIVETYPHKDMILRAAGSGSGGGGGGGGGGGPKDEIAGLQAQLKKAQENNDAQTMIAIRNKINQIQRDAA